MMGVFESQFRVDAPYATRAKGVLSALPTVSFEAGIVCLAVGIAAYFAWPSEPSRLVVCALLIGALLATWTMPIALKPLGHVLALCLMGMVWSSLSSWAGSPNPLDREYRLDVTARVAMVEDRKPMRRLYLDIATVDPLPASGMPERLRIRVGKAFGDVRTGDAIALRVVAKPLPGPAIPQGYDPARRAFFDGLSGSGFAISGWQPASIDPSMMTRFGTTVTRIRQGIVQRVLARAPERTAGLQAALLTGIRDHIPAAQTESLRASGLAHILAISGLHMGMVAFGIFTATAAVLAAVERLSRAVDVRKYAAIVGLIFATLYLGLSGASVATQRAYIMVCIAFLAIILDRRAISLRSVAVAALITLAIRPEALLSVGFQMSFAAVTAMVVAFRAWQDHRPPRRAVGLRDRITAFYGSLFGTSLIAGFATGVFALLHFGRIAQYGLLANMIAMAVFPIVMALGIVALLVMPMGWEGLPLYAMGRLIEFMLIVAEWVASLPGGVSNVRASPPHVIALYGLGFALACFATRRSLIVGVAAMSLAIMLWRVAPRDHVRITETARISVLSQESDAENAGQTSSLRADRYGREQFARASGTPDVGWSNYRDDYADCDALACRITYRGRIISVVDAPSEVPAACEDSDVVVLTERRVGPVARRGCKALLFDAAALRRTGGVHLRFDEKIIVRPMLSPRRGRRPWGVSQQSVG